MGLATTTRTQQFAGKIIVEKTTGKKKLEIASPKFYQHQINKFTPNDPVSIYITNQRPKRTILQNNYLWGVYYPAIAEETGESDVDKLHTLFKGKFLTKGIYKVLGENVRVVGSTTDLSTSEFGQFIMDIENLTQIKAPPTENWGLEALKYKR